jgi:hypothetical protein
MGTHGTLEAEDPAAAPLAAGPSGRTRAERDRRRFVGWFNALTFGLPEAYGREDKCVAREIDNALGSVLATTAVTVAAFLALLQVVPFDGGYRTALSLGGLGALLYTPLEYLLLVLRVQRRVLPLGLTHLVRSTGMPPVSWTPDLSAMRRWAPSAPPRNHHHDGAGSGA